MDRFLLWIERWSDLLKLDGTAVCEYQVRTAMLLFTRFENEGTRSGKGCDDNVISDNSD